jgi:hypothetical protein
MIDQNLNYSVLGIAAAAGLLTSTSVTFTAGESSQAGEVTSLDLKFTTTIALPAGTEFRLTFPSEYPPTLASCTAFQTTNYKLPDTISCIATG